MIKRTRNLTIGILAVVALLCAICCAIMFFSAPAIAEEKQYKAIAIFGEDSNLSTTQTENISGDYSAHNGTGLFTDIKVGSTMQTINAQQKIYIDDNTKTDALFSLSILNLTSSSNGIFIYLTDSAKSMVTVRLYGSSVVALHATTAAPGQEMMGLRSGVLDTSKANHLVTGEYANEEVKVSYDKAENALYINEILVRDFDEVYDSYGDGWSGFSDNVVSLSVKFQSYNAVVTNVDGQSLALDTTTGIVNAVKQIPYWTQTTENDAANYENIVPAMEGYDYFAGVSEYASDYQVEIVDGEDVSVLTKQTYSSQLKYIPASVGAYTIKYYSADGQTLLAEKEIVAIGKYTAKEMFSGDIESISATQPASVSGDYTSLEGTGVFVDKDYSESYENIIVNNVYIGDNTASDNLFSIAMLDLVSSSYGVYIDIIDDADSNNLITVQIWYDAEKCIRIASMATGQKNMSLRDDGSAKANYYLEGYTSGTALNFNYDFETNAMYFNGVKIREYDVANTQDSVTWSGFSGKEVTIKFRIRTYHSFISSVDGQPLASDESGFVNEVKNIAYWDYAISGTQNQKVIVKQAKYFNFFDGAYDYSGEYQVEILDTNNIAVLAKTDYVDGLSFTPETAGEYTVKYYFADGTERSSIVTIAEPLLTSTTLTIVNGAYVRVVDPIGIRFVIDMEKAEYDKYVADGYTVTLGVLIAPTSYIKTYGELSFENTNYVVGTNLMNVVGDAEKFRIYENGGVETLSVQAVDAISDVYKYSRAYTAVGYIKLEKEGFSDVAYTASVSRSLYEVAAKALASDSAEYYGESATQVLEDIVSAVNENYEVVESGENYSVVKKADSQIAETNIPACYFDLDTKALYVYDSTVDAFIKQ